VNLRQRLRIALEGTTPGLAARLDSLWISLASRRSGLRPLVTVLIAHRDQPKAALRTVRSAIAQSYPNVECVVIGSASSSADREQLREMLPADVRVIDQPCDLGSATAFNQGLSHASGRWIVPMIAGESLSPHSLWRLVRAAEQAGASGASDPHRSILLIDTQCVRGTGGFAPDLEPPDLVPDAVARLASLGHVLASAPHAAIRDRAPRPSLPVSVPVDVVFMPHNAYHTREMAAIASELERRGVTSLFIDITNHYADEGSGKTMRELGLEHTHSTRDLLDHARPGVLFVMNDWSPPVHDRVIECRSRSTRSIALVEGVQDYLDTHVEHLGMGVHRGAYRHADVALLVGEHDTKFFEGRDARVTGSTRIEQLALEAKSAHQPTNRSQRVVINSNFTYGLYTNAQGEWLASAVKACETLGVEFVISRHHADEFDFAAHGMTPYVSARPLYEELREARVLVSRFSGVLLEAMALGIAVIYHNPHNERIDKFLDPQGTFPITRNREELERAIEHQLEADPAEIAKRQQPFFAQHVSIEPDRPSWIRIADEIERELAMVQAVQDRSAQERTRPSDRPGS